MEKWVEKDSKHIYKNKVTDIYAKQYLLPNGNTLNVHILSGFSASVVLPITDDGHVVLVRQYRPAGDDFFWELPAGLVEHDEDHCVAAARELEEETGYSSSSKPIYVTTLLPNPAHSTNKLYCYLATGVHKIGSQHLDENEDIEVKMFTIDEVIRMIENGQMNHMFAVSAFWVAYHKYLQLSK